MKHIVKRKGHVEDYDNKKVYASVYSSCMNAHYTEQESEKIAQEVMDKIDNWIKSKLEVNSVEIRKEIVNLLIEKDYDIAYLYHTIFDIC